MEGKEDGMRRCKPPVLCATLRLVALALVPAVLLLNGCFTLTRPALPKTSGRIAVEGLDGPVEIYRDEVGVAHIVASSDHDLFFAQGFVHAQDRFYQMEFWRRIGAGRLSELFGESTLASDIYLRTMGFRRTAEREYAEAPPLLKEALDAYAAGVNAWISDKKPRQLAAEFALLGLLGQDLEIEPWTPPDSLTWPKVMSEDMGLDYRQELLRLDMIRSVGIDMTRDYFGEYRYGEMPTTILQEDLDGGAEGAVASTSSPAPGPADDLALWNDPVWRAAVEGIPSDSLVFRGQEELIQLAFAGDATTGTNQWVVSGDFTSSGLPTFANDPHLGMQMPSIWYEVSLHMTGNESWNCHGYSFAGMPGIVIGHNDHIIWGMSTASPDVQDLYVELINPENPLEYRVGNEWVEMETRQEVVEVAGEEPYVFTVRTTRNGPIVTDSGGAVPYSSFDVRPTEMFPTDIQITELALKWTALEPTYPMYAVLLYDRARNFSEFREALSYFHTPSHNYLYADVEGNIGFVHPGRIPVRGNGSGSLPSPGWDDAWQWQGFIPPEELPWLLNPARGYITNENNPVMPEGMQLFGEHMYTPGLRAYRASELVTEAMADGNVTFDEHVAIQTDLHSELAARVLPHVLDIPTDVIAGVPAAGEALELLREWDLRMHEESVGATVFAQFYVELLELTYADQIPAHVWEGPWEASEKYRMQRSLLGLVVEPDNAWWDDVRTVDHVETRNEIMARALGAAYTALEARLDDDPRKWEWGKIHTLTYTNATLGTSGVGFVEKLFNRGPVPISGGLNVLFRNDFEFPTAFDVTHITSMRMIADLSDWSRTLWINSPGQSGHPASRHYDDAIDAYAEGRYFTHPWTLEEIADEARDLLVLEPDES
jgi:penicillin amidase